jgi:hypothetical protein
MLVREDYSHDELLEQRASSRSCLEHPTDCNEEGKEFEAYDYISAITIVAQQKAADRRSVYHMKSLVVMESSGKKNKNGCTLLRSIWLFPLIPGWKPDAKDCERHPNVSLPTMICQQHCQVWGKRPVPSHHGGCLCIRYA